MVKFYVIYRTGTPEKCVWKRSVALPKSEAEKQAKFFTGCNVKAFVVPKKISDVIGIPEDWEYKKKGNW